MILPTKHLRADRSLLALGGEIIAITNEPKTVSRVWQEFSQSRNRSSGSAPVSYDWFVLALDLLFIVGALSLSAGRIVRSLP